VMFDVDSTRMTYNGFGSTKPLAKNDTEEGRKLNRRVEFTITKK
jgi:flagellar motor protein MotB